MLKECGEANYSQHSLQFCKNNPLLAVGNNSRRTAFIKQIILQYQCELILGKYTINEEKEKLMLSTEG